MLYFVDTYANYHDPQVGEALVSILEHNGVAVYVHPGQLSSAMPMIAQGALGPARRSMRITCRTNVARHYRRAEALPSAERTVAGYQQRPLALLERHSS